jgi:hypothetical protein
MRVNVSLLLAGACLAIALCCGSASAQSITLPLGQVNLPIKSVSCPSGYDTGTACYTSTISCPSTDEIGFIYGVYNAGGTDGTVVFFNGDDGEQPGFTQYISSYTPPFHNYQTVQAIWLSPWEDTGNGIGNSLKTAACRPATLMDWLLRQKKVYAGGGMCAQGASAGSAAISYALTQYGAGGYLQHVVLESGPVLSNISIGCNKSSSVVTVCPGNQCFTGKQGSWTDSPVYVDGAETAVSLWTDTTGNQACSSGNKISAEQYDDWTAMSIVDGITGRLADTTFSYPRTTMSGWLCNKPAGCHSAICQNNSAAQGQLYYENVTSRKNVYRVDNCLSTEGVEEGTVPQLDNQPGLQAIISDMVGQCK